MDHYVRQNRRSPKYSLGGGGSNLLTPVNKPLKMLGFFPKFDTLNPWVKPFPKYQFINRVNFLRSVKNE